MLGGVNYDVDVCLTGARFAKKFWEAWGMTTPNEAVARLAMAVKARRGALGMSQLDVAAAGGPSDTTQSKIELGLAAKIGARTLAKYDHALQWTPGQAASIFSDEAAHGLAALIPTGPEDEDAPRSLAEYTQRATARAATRTARHHQLLSVILGVVEDTLRDVALAQERSTAVDKQVMHAGLLLDTVARFADIVQGAEFEDIQSRVRRDSERYAAQRLRLGLPIGVGTGDPRSRVEGTLDAMAAAQEEALADAEDRAKERRQSEYDLVANRDLGQESVGRKIRRAQDEAGELPDPDGPEGGA